MKILLLSHRFFPDIGGIETMSELLAKSFLEVGHEVHLMTWSKHKEVKKFPYTIIRNPSILKLFKEHRWSDVTLENNPCIKLAWPSFFFRKSHIIILQTWIINRYKLIWLKHARKIIACSTAIQERCWPKASVIGNSYNINTFKIFENVERNKDFVFVGRLVSDKGAALAIKALFHLQTILSKEEDKAKKYSLTIIGDGPDRNSLEDLVNNLQVQDYVRFTGALRGKELSNCLNQHRFILVPSIWDEPFGIVALEGMACGCLPIVSDGGGLPDAIGNAGLTFLKGDMIDLVKCILKVLNDPELEQQLRYSAKSHLAAYHPHLISQRYLDIIASTTYK